MSTHWVILEIEEDGTESVSGPYRQRMMAEAVAELTRRLADIERWQVRVIPLHVRPRHKVMTEEEVLGRGR